MTISLLKYRCPCGTVTTKVTNYLTSTHEVLIQWVCKKCGQEVQYRQSLASLWRECPEDKQVELPKFDDDAWLRRIGVDPQPPQ